MGRPQSNGAPAFRFNPAEVTEMENILQACNAVMPTLEVLQGLAHKFSVSAERSGKLVIQPKQVYHWFQNRRHTLRGKATKIPGILDESLMHQEYSTRAKRVTQVFQQVPVPLVRNVPQAPRHLAVRAGKGRNRKDNTEMEFEAKSARDGAWYDVAAFLSHRNLETGDPVIMANFF